MATAPDLDVALSYAGEDRAYVDRVAHLLRDRGVKLFYDRFDEAGLWGKDLYAHLADVYQRRARFTVMFISAAYGEKLWTNHERKAAQARAFEEAHEYILPARFDDTVIPGVLPTVGYVSLVGRPAEELVELIIRKLEITGGLPPAPAHTNSDAIPETSHSGRSETVPKAPAGPWRAVAEDGPKVRASILRSLLGPRQMAIDLGTASTRILIPGEGVVLDEPSVIAVEVRDGRTRVKAVGVDVWGLQVRRRDSIRTIRPVRNGAIADPDAAKQMLRYFIRKARGSPGIGRTLEVVIAVPGGATNVEREAFYRAALEAGAGKVGLIDAPTAAAIGEGMPVAAPIGTMVVDLGAGKTEVALLSACGLVYKRLIRTGGNAMDEAISKRIRQHHNLHIDLTTAEKMKNEVGTAGWISADEDCHVWITGRDGVNLGPSEISVRRTEVREALTESVHAVLEAVRLAVETIPPELARDVIDQGIGLTGGVARLQNLSDVIRDKTGLPVWIADEPLTSVARGMGRILENADLRSVLLDN